MTVSWVSREWYNVTKVNASDMLTFTRSVRELYFNPLGDMILLIIFFVSFQSFNHFNNNPRLNFMFCSFIIAMSSIFLRLMGLISDFTPFFAWGLFALAISVVAFTR